MDSTSWSVFLTILKILYAGCSVILFTYGLNSLGLSLIYLLHRKQANKILPPEAPAKWPSITIQLPIYNERYMVQRLLKAVSNLDYPADRLHIQVLDDSTDSTSELVSKLVRKIRSDGINIEYVKRDSREGFKAGALSSGLKTSNAEFVAVFDADFIPGKKWLKHSIVYFNDPKIGFVQTRWSHLNFNYNLLTRMEGLALDGHFIVEQNARSQGGLLMGFNGSGGIWRRACIEDAGGWQPDTLTEDLDLSYRAQIKGWKKVYLPSITVPSEIPAQIDAVKKQQFRWAKGSTQTLRKLSGKVLHSDLSFKQKLFALAHLAMYMPFPFLLLTLILVLPVGLYIPHYLTYFSWAAVASFGPLITYSLAKTEHLPRLRDRWLVMLPLLFLGIGLSVTCSIGTISGLFKNGGVFERTPKFNITDKKDNWRQTAYVITRNPIVWVEVLMGLYLLIAIYLLFPIVGFTLAPWLLTSAGAFFMVAGGSLIQQIRLAFSNNSVPEPENKIQ
jgi:cellulose synthase/poly-beta-1,6-N-acetylglucosamine synthase-like glycosyltransferase